jgi:hypothetical protein
LQKARSVVYVAIRSQQAAAGMSATGPISATGFPPATVHIADSVVASLCREVDAIRQRSRVVLQAMACCQNSGLLLRLRRDLAQLQERRRELLAIARAWQRRGVADPLGMAFLIEISSRPLPC